MLYVLLWSIINLLDGEASWFLSFLLLLTIASVATHALRWLSAKLQERFTQNNELIKNAALQASVLPLSCYIWFVTAILCMDLLSDHFLSETFTTGLKIIFSISGVLFLLWFLLRVNSNIRHVLLERSKKREIALDPGQVHSLTKLASVVILLLGAILLMEVTGVSFTTLIAFGGISGLAIAFASQEVIANFFGGIMIHINQPFAMGDLIHLPNANLEGTVEEIGWYETRLRSKDKQPIYIPNALFSKAYVINSSRRSHRQIHEKISIRHEDLPKAQSIVAAIRTYLQENRSVDSSQKNLVYIAQIGTYSIDITINCLSTYIDETQFLKFRDELIVHAVSIVNAQGAELAIPLEAIVSVEKK